MKHIKILFIITLILTALPTVGAQTTLPWITEYTLTNHSTGQTVLEWSSETGEVLEFFIAGAAPLHKPGFPVVPIMSQPVDCPPGDVQLHPECTANSG